MTTAFGELRLAIRSTGRSPVFAVASVLVMAVGLGTVAAIFSICLEMLLRPYPFDRPSELRIVQAVRSEDGGAYGVSLSDLEDVRHRSRVFRDLAAVRSQQMPVAGGGLEEPVLVNAALATPNLFDVVGAEVEHGPGLRAAREEHGAIRLDLVVLSEGLWRRAYGADPKIFGSSIDVGGRPHSVVGVVEDRYAFPGSAELWTPMPPSRAAQDREVRSLLAVGRLDPGVSSDQAVQDLNRIALQLADEHPTTNQRWGLVAKTLGEFRAGPWSQMLVILGVLSVCVLLLSCVNVGTLLLDRALVRQKEMAIRYAIGASRVRVLWSILAESLVVAILGTGVGLLLAHWFLRSLVSSLPAQLAADIDFTVNPAVFLVTLGAAVASALLASVLPSLFASRQDGTQALKEGAGCSEGRSRQGTRRVLVAGEIAVSFALLMAAGLLTRSFLALQATDPGHRLDDVLAAQVVLPPNPYSDEGERLAFYTEVHQRLVALPGVEGAGAGSFLPFDPWGTTTVESAGSIRTVSDASVATGLQRVDGAYFETIGMPLLGGRVFTPADDERSEPVVIVNQLLARRLWPSSEPVGQLLSLGDGEPTRTVVGVVGNVERIGFEPTPYDAYVPYRQAPAGSMVLFVDSMGRAEDLAPALRNVLSQVAPEVRIRDLGSLRGALEDSIAPQRSLSRLVATLGLAALVLALGGLYGFVSCSVTRQHQEMAIRMALGASPRRLVRSVAGRMLRLVTAGLVVGCVLGALLVLGIEGFLFGVSPLDPLTYLGVGALFVLTAAFAGLLPASRAGRVAPMSALQKG